MREFIKTAIPCIFTISNLVSGIISIFCSADGKFENAAWWILISVLLDKIDGTVARILKVSSDFGKELDSLSDLIAFGLAPAMLVRGVVLQNMPSEIPLYLLIIIYICVTVFIISAAMRLARFNVLSSKDDKFFTGVPTTLCGAVIASFYLTVAKQEFPQFILSFSFVLLIILGALMLSNLKIPKIGKSGSRNFNVFQIFAALFVYTITILRLFPEVLFSLSLLYLFGGMYLGFRKSALK
jgi:CDP-diacylglycerol--serine O-phosphatidyltransferase